MGYDLASTRHEKTLDARCWIGRVESKTSSLQGARCWLSDFTLECVERSPFSLDSITVLGCENHLETLRATCWSNHIKPYQSICNLLNMRLVKSGTLSQPRWPKWYGTHLTNFLGDSSGIVGGYAYGLFFIIYIYVCMYVWVQILSMFRIYIYIIYYILYIILYIYIILHTHGLCMSISLWITYKLGFTSARPKNEVRDEDASKTLATTSVFAPNMWKSIIQNTVSGGCLILGFIRAIRFFEQLVEREHLKPETLVLYL